LSILYQAMRLPATVAATKRVTNSPALLLNASRFALATALAVQIAPNEPGWQADPGTVLKLQSKLASVITQDNGGLFSPNRMWSAVVDRNGVLCSVIRSSSDPWPGSRSIAIAKASTANDFSNSLLALSTANLYSFTQPANSNSSSSLLKNREIYDLGSFCRNA
jgi:hypothetical protein